MRAGGFILRVTPMISDAPLPLGGPNGLVSRRSEPKSPNSLSYRQDDRTRANPPVRMTPETTPAEDSEKVDSATPFKRVRKSHASGDSKKASLLGMKGLWLVPFLAETVLLFGAVWLTICLQRIVLEGKLGFPTSSVVAIAVVYVGLAIYCKVQELFLPRAAVFLGVGVLTLISLGCTGGFLSDAFLMGGRPRFYNALLVVMPLNLFTLRCILLFREARFTPNMDSLAPRLKVKSNKIAELRRTLRFWLS
jgi:hypothetical protein